MDRQEIIDLLEKARRWILLEGGVVCPHKFGLCKHDNENCPVFCIDQALTLFKQQPKAGEFTNQVRLNLENWKSALDIQTDVRVRTVVRWLNEALVIIDEQKVQLKAKDELLFAYESVRAPKLKIKRDGTPPP